MPTSRAYRLCPQAIFVRPRFEAYQEVSQYIRQIFLDFTDLVEPLSLDEAYLDVTGSERNNGSATLIAKAIKSRIKQRTQLTASAGVSYNKFLAKIASDLKKPDGLCLITPAQGVKFIENHPIHKFHGVGKATAHKMQNLGIQTGNDLKSFSLESLQQHFGKAALHYYNIARGIDDRPVINSRTSQSVGVETTYQQDISNAQTVVEQLGLLFDKALAKVTEKQLSAHTLTVKIKYHDFVQITRSRTLHHAFNDSSKIKDLLTELLKKTDVGCRAVRLLGITLSSLNDPAMFADSEQADLFESIS
jgi:DNA polymerase-4